MNKGVVDGELLSHDDYYQRSDCLSGQEAVQTGTVVFFLEITPHDSVCTEYSKRKQTANSAAHNGNKNKLVGTVSVKHSKTEIGNKSRYGNQKKVSDRKEYFADAESA